MRRGCAAAVIVVVGLAIPGCGGGSGGEAGLSPALASALAYLPRDAPVAAVVPTDLNRPSLAALDQRASKLTGWRELKKQFEQQFDPALDFDRDIRPQLGNPLVVSASTLDTNDYLQIAALEVKDPRAMRRLLDHGVSRGQDERLPDYKGALVTRDLRKGPGEKQKTRDTFTAIHGSIAVQASSEAALKAAIDRSDGSDNLAHNEKVTAALDQGGQDLLFRATGDTGLLVRQSHDADAVAARKLEWVRALGNFEVAGFVTSDGLRFEFDQKTDREDPAIGDLPLATGPEPARLHDPQAPIAIGVRDPDSLYGFFERAFKVTQPAQYSSYRAAISQLSSLGIDVHKGVLRKITNLSLALESQQAGSFQATLSAGAGASLRSFLQAAQPFIEGALSSSDAGQVQVTTAGNGDARAWTVRRANGKVVARYGVRGDTVVGSLGRVPVPNPVGGESLPAGVGALGIALSGGRFSELVRQIDRQGGPAVADGSGRRALRLISALGAVRMSLRAETSALTGRGELVLPPPRQ